MATQAAPYGKLLADSAHDCCRDLELRSTVAALMRPTREPRDSLSMECPTRATDTMLQAKYLCSDLSTFLPEADPACRDLQAPVSRRKS